MKFPYRILLLWFGWLIASPIGATPPEGYRESGIPLYSMYNLGELEVGLSNLNLAQDPIGRLVIYEDGNLFTFNGNRWRRQLELHSGDSVMVKLAQSDDGTFYAGAIGDWGKLVTSESGNYRFESLSMGMDRSWASTNRFTMVVPEPEGAVFIGETAIVRYHAQQGNQTWKWLSSPSAGFRLKEKTYIATQEDGVFMLEGGKLEQIPSLEGFRGEQAIFNTVASGDGTVMLSTRSRGLFRFNGNHAEPIPTEIDALMESAVTGIASIEGGYVAIAIKGHGIYFLDEDFRRVASIDRKVDGTFVSATDLHYQDGGLLWVSVPDGIAKIHFPSPTTLIDERMGAFLLWPKLHRHAGKLYVASNGSIFEGVYDDRGNLERFEAIQVPGSPILRSALMTDTGLLYGRENAIYHWDLSSETADLVVDGVTSNMMKALKTRTDHVIVLGADFHQLLRRDGPRWVPVGAKVASSGYSCVAVENEQGDVWVEHGINQFARLAISDEGMRVSPYSRVHGLPEGWVNLWTWKDTTYASCNGGIMQFDHEAEEFVEAKLPPWLKPDMAHEVVRPQEDPDGNVWITSGGKMFIMRAQGDTWVRDNETLALIKENQQELFLDGEGGAFIFSKNRIFAFDSRIVPADPLPFEPILERISTTNQDRVLFSGIFDTNEENPVLPYRENALDFRFFSTALYQTRNLRFSYMLEGLDAEWSSPSMETHAVYTNLSEGKYRFRLRTLDVGGTVKGEARYGFVVEPPFYRSLPAYIAYVVAGLCLIYLLQHWTLRKSELEQSRLERLVRERTEQLDSTNQELQDAVIRAEDAKNAKSRFLANMSHEIRTPLNGVVGMTEILKRMKLEREQQEIVDTIENSSHLLLSVINDVLDYSRFESGPMEFEHIGFDPVRLLENALSLLHHLAVDNGNVFYADIDPAMPRALLGDVTRIEQILVNLASNALKFTRDGEVCIRARMLVSDEHRSTLEITVIDSGIGIAPDKQRRLFQPFSQVDPSNTRIYGGSGLGLAICKKLVDEMGGTIGVSSEVGKGSSFTVTLPLAKPAAGEDVQTAETASTPLRVLYVDAHEGRGGAIQRFLTHAGVDCMHVQSLDAAASVLAGQPPVETVVFESYPGAEPMRELLRLMESPGFSPHVLVYAHPLEQLDDERVDETLVKPVKPSRLAARVSQDASGPGDLTGDSRGSGFDSLVQEPLEILLVEDNRVNQKVTQLMLQKMQLSCDLAEDGNRALECIGAKQYDLVLMDIQMPGMDGIEATRRIRERTELKQPKIFALSAGTMADEVERAIEAGMDGFISKPMVLDRLREVLDQVRRSIAAQETSSRS